MTTDLCHATLNEVVTLLELTDPYGRRQGEAAPEDGIILQLCERIGFGPVMDSVARQWRVRDPDGAFTVGPPIRLVQLVLLQVLQVLEFEQPPPPPPGEMTSDPYL